MKILQWAVICLLVVGLTGCMGGGRRRPKPYVPNPARAPAPPPKKDMPINAALRERAAAELERAVHSDDPIIRAHALESIAKVRGEGSDEVVLDALDDEVSVVRFAAAMAAGDMRLAAAKPKLLELVSDNQLGVQIAVRYALHRIGYYRYSHDLETFAQDPNPRVRANTALVLGLLGEPSAMNILGVMKSDRDPAVALQVAEAMWRLKEMEGFEKLVAAAQSAYADFQLIAVQAMAAPGDQRVTEHVRSKLTAEHEEVSLAAAAAMGKLGSDAGYTIAQRGVQRGDSRQQLLAAMAFAEIGRVDAQPILEPLLDHGDADVRLAAATALLRLE